MKSRLLLFNLLFVCLCSSAYATFPGQNGKIVFVRNDVEFGVQGISIMNSDGSGELILTAGANDWSPKWSADGSKIVFVRGSGFGNIFTMNADGSNITQVTTEGDYLLPNFSRDGSQIFFQKGSTAIGKMNVDGSNETILVDGTSTVCQQEEDALTLIEVPAVSSDGSKIGFDVECYWCGDDGCGRYADLFTINSDGSNLTRITQNSRVANRNVWDYSVTWSPDGTKIVYTHSEHADDNYYSVVIANSDGSSPLPIVTSSESFLDPTFSPDGTKILFDGGNRLYNLPNPTGLLYTMNLDGTGITSITDGTVFRSWPDWQPIPSQNNTQPGTDIEVNPINENILPGEHPVSVTFDSVTQSGDTTVTSSTQGPPPPSSFKLGTPPVYYEISTTSVFSGFVTLCFSWTEGQFRNENKIKLFHNENNAWVDVTTSINTANNIVCGKVSSLSPFVLFENFYEFTGFFSPVDNPPTRNSVKAGQAIPVKFSLGGDEGLNIFDSGYPSSQQIQCDTGTPIDAVEETVNAGESSLSYDAVSGRYIYVWKTNKAWANSCRRMTLQFNDGTVEYADFSLTK